MSKREKFLLSIAVSALTMGVIYLLFGACYGLDPKLWTNEDTRTTFIGMEIMCPPIMFVVATGILKEL